MGTNHFVVETFLFFDYNVINSSLLCTGFIYRFLFISYALIRFSVSHSFFLFPKRVETKTGMLDIHPEHYRHLMFFLCMLY